MAGGVKEPDRRLVRPSITVGAGRMDPQGHPVAISEDGGTVEGWRSALMEIQPAECAWWSPHVWSRDYALAQDWIGAHGLAIDLDYEDPRLGSKRHTDCTREAWADLYNLTIDGDLPCNLLHATPRGARAIVVFDRVTHHRREVAQALRAAAHRIAEALSRAGLDRVIPEGSGYVRPGFWVDRSCLDLKRIFWAPRCTVNGEARMAEVHVIDREPTELTELVLAAPEPETEASPAMGGKGSSDYSEAARKWCDDHPIDFRVLRRECPACGHKGCFGPCPEALDRWFCFSANHDTDSGGCGQPSKTQPDAFWGDALDLESHRRGTTPRDVLRQDGYLDHLPDPGLLDGIDISGIMATANGQLAAAERAIAEETGGLVPPTGGEEKARQRARWAFEIQDLQAALALQPPPAIVDGLLREQDIGVLFGAPGCGKSFVAIALALALASGEPWLGREVAGPAPVLYIAGEGAYGIGKRVLAWAGGTIPARSPVWENWRQLTALVPLLDTEAFPALLRSVEQLAEEQVRPRLIIVDTLARAMTGGDENSAKDMGLFVHRCGELRERTGAAVLLVHHSGKAGGAERGSSALRGACDVMMALEKDDAGDVTLTVTKTKDDRPPDPIDVELRRVVLGEDAAGKPISSLRADRRDPNAPKAGDYGAAPMLVLKVLRDQPAGTRCSFREIQDTTRLHRNSVAKVMRMLQAEDRVTVGQTGNTKWAVLRADQDDGGAA